MKTYLIVNPRKGLISETGFVQDTAQALRFCTFGEAKMSLESIALSDPTAKDEHAIARVTGNSIDTSFFYRYGYAWEEVQITNALQECGCKYTD